MSFLTVFQALFVCVIVWNTARIERSEQGDDEARCKGSSTNKQQTSSYRSDTEALTHTPSPCDMDICVDYIRCNPNKQFLLYFYTEADSDSSFLTTQWAGNKHLDAVKSRTYFTNDPHRACFFVIVIDTWHPGADNKPESSEVEHALHSLPHWNKDGANNIIVHFTRSQSTQDILWRVNTGKAIISQSAYRREHFRPDYDILLPGGGLGVSESAGVRETVDHIREYPMLLPAYRYPTLQYPML